MPEQGSNASLIQSAQDYIKDYIRENNLKAGDPLPTEKDIAAALGLSRTVIREALRGLQQLGVTSSRQGKGHFLCDFDMSASLKGFDYIVKPSLESFRDLLEIRMYLESAFLTRDAFFFTEDDFEELAAMIGEMEKKIADKAEEDELINMHTRFHQALYKHSGNQFLLELISMFSSMQHKFISIYGYHTSDRDDFVRGHREILGSLRGRQPEVVRSVLINHFSEPLSWVRERLGADQGDSVSEGVAGGKASCGTSE